MLKPHFLEMHLSTTNIARHTRRTCVPRFDMYALAVVAETLLYAIKKGCIVLEKEVSISTGVLFISFSILLT